MTEVTITAISLRGRGKDLVVEVEFADAPGQWVEVIREPLGEVSPISHIVEGSGIVRAREEALK